MNKPKIQSGPSFTDIASKVGHISSKTVNTNVFAAVRYAPEDVVSLPYVSVRTMLAVPGMSQALMDYQGNAALSRYAKSLLGIAEPPAQGSNTKSVKKLQAPLPECPPETRKRLNSRELIGEQDSVNARLRQVLLYNREGRGNPDDYVSVTPLESSGLGALLRSKVQPLMAREKEKIRPRLASMPIGGSKPQNVGIRVRDMACLFVGTPTADFTAQSATRAAFNGIQVLPTEKLLHQWRNSGQLSRLCAGLGNRAEKDRFAQSVHPLAQDILKRARIASIQVEALLERHSESLRKAGWTESQVEDDREEAWAEVEVRLGVVQFGFLKPELRSPEWGERTAWAITNAIDHWLIRESKKKVQTESEERPILTDSAKMALLNALAKGLT